MKYKYTTIDPQDEKIGQECGSEDGPPSSTKLGSPTKLTFSSPTKLTLLPGNPLTTTAADLLVLREATEENCQ